MADATRDTGTVLDQIVSDRRQRLAEDRDANPTSTLADEEASLPGSPVDFRQRLLEGRASTPDSAKLRLVAEVKRASPSRGVFNADLDAANQARIYADAGASAVSVLTEPDHFRGNINDLRAARCAFGDDHGRPALLRKDFVFDRYQVLEAKAHGADAVLLIVMMLTEPALSNLMAITLEEGLEPLVEVHDEAEMETALRVGARVLGVNNRDLRTFREDLSVTERIAPLAPPGTVVVAESGIKTMVDARRMAEAGAHALLVGEALVRSGASQSTSGIRSKAHELMLTDASP